MLNIANEHRIPTSTPFHLSSHKADESRPFKTKEEAEVFTAEMTLKIRELQYRMFVERQQSLLIVLQAPDAAGKDGLIRRVLGRMNPQGCRTYPFKAPTEEELAHDFLWRVHKCTPAKGMVSIFNRSHYEDVLVVRVHNLVSKEVWKKGFDQINHFEQLLVENRMTILKCFLHVSNIGTWSIEDGELNLESSFGIGSTWSAQ